MVGDDEMKKTKIAIILTAVVALATVAIGFAFAHNMGGNNFFGGMMGYPSYAEGEDWWTDMRDHMGEDWEGIEDEEWFDDMTAYMDEHLADLESQEWYDDMVDYMDEHGYGNHMGFGFGGCH
jgi:hypothetical protein